MAPSAPAEPVSAVRTASGTRWLRAPDSGRSRQSGRAAEGSDLLRRCRFEAQRCPTRGRLAVRFRPRSPSTTLASRYPSVRWASPRTAAWSFRRRCPRRAGTSSARARQTGRHHGARCTRGHSRRRAGAVRRLREAQGGQHRDGHRPRRRPSTIYRVVEVMRVAKSRAPLDGFSTGPVRPGWPCSPAAAQYDRTAGSYRDNVIVLAESDLAIDRHGGATATVRVSPRMIMSSSSTTSGPVMRWRWPGSTAGTRRSSTASPCVRWAMWPRRRT